jgi:choline/glycine/proline betaine transport protein
LKALRKAAVAAALPVSALMLLVTYGIVKSLKENSSAVAEGDTMQPPHGTSLRRELNA